MKNKNKNNVRPGHFQGCKSIAGWLAILQTRRALARIGLALLALMAMTPAILAQNQTVIVRSQPTRITIPVNSTTTTITTNTVTMAGTNAMGGVTPVDLAVAITALPAMSASASLSILSFSASGSNTLTLNTTNIPQGEYNVAIDATGGATYRLPIPLIAGYVWNGPLGANWAAGGSWVGGVAPGTMDNVVFTDQGGTTNSGTNATAIISADTEVAALRFAQNISATRRHNIEIQSGATLRVTGSGSLSILKDVRGASASESFFRGPGALVVSNQNADIALLNEGANVVATLDLSGLSNFVADVRQLGLGDYRLYPDYGTNGYTGGGTGPGNNPARFIHAVLLARTNLIKATRADANNYMDPAFRDYSLIFSHGEQQGSSTMNTFRLGFTNGFYLDSFCFSGSGAQGNMNFLASGSSAYFRNANGGRMSVFAISDGAAPGASGSGVRGTVDLNNGTVNAMVDRLYIARERTNSTGANAVGTLILGAGSFDVNNAILGFQGQGNNLGAGNASCQGNLTVSNTAVFVANQTIELGHTTATTGNSIETGFGRISAINGGTVMASNITVGGVTKLTVGNTANNTITLTGGGKLILSHAVAAADAKLGTLTMNDSTLTLHVVAGATNVHVQALVTGGAGNTVKVASLTGVGSFPVQLPLISYESASPNYVADVSALGAGFFGYMINNTADKTIDIFITTTAPKMLVWDGLENANWNGSSLNWNGGATNFATGDFVLFDDSSSVNSVTVVDTVIIGQAAGSPGMIVSNAADHYTFSGGTIGGTGSILKQEAGTLTMDATSQGPLTIRAGTVDGSGVLGATTVGSGATLAYSGTVNGGVISTGTVVNPGTIKGAVSIQGGTLENSGTVITAPGSMTLAAGTKVTNTVAGTMGVAGGAWIVPANATLANFGFITNVVNRLNVDGTLVGTGTFVDGTGGAPAGTGRVAIRNGGTFSPGNSIGTVEVQGRLDLDNGSTTVIEVDLNNPAINDLVTIDYGGNLQTRFVMNNVGSIPFAAGQNFTVIRGNFGTILTNANAAHIPLVSPVVPGVGLQWDVSLMRVTNTLRIIRVISAPTTPPTLTNMVSAGMLKFTWPSTHLGWQLQEQTNNLAFGVSTNGADWSGIATSESTNQFTVAIDPGKPSEFYRLFIP